MEEIVVASGWRVRLEELAGRRRDALTIAAVVVVVTAVALLAWGRTAPANVAPPSSVAVTPGPLDPGSGDEIAGSVVYVHVAGAVAEPGLYVLSEGARVADAVDAAGGPRRRAALDLVNLAQILADGMKVEVPRRGEVTGGGGGPGVGAAGPGEGAVVSINTADQPALETVPGLGPVKAGAIVHHREEIGPFTALEQVMEVSGIGPATFEQIRPYISL